MLEFAIKSAVFGYVGVKSANYLLTKTFFNPSVYTPLSKLLRGDPMLKYLRVLKDKDIYHSPLFSSRDVNE